MTQEQEFGGVWTEEKLNLLSNYFVFYNTALKNYGFKRLYIDAFAGSGEIKSRTGTLLGSAQRALMADFNSYIFIDINEEHCNKLHELVRTKYPQKVSSVRIIQGEANTIVQQLAKTELKDKRQRGIIFLDPYAMSVNWSCIQAIKSTEILDLWYLFPWYALKRSLPINRERDDVHNKVSSVIGMEDWENYVYKRTESLFTEIENVILLDDMKLQDFLIERLSSVFGKSAVAPKPRVLKNGNSTPIYLLLFAVSNPKAKAQILALKCANHLLIDSK